MPRWRLPAATHPSSGPYLLVQRPEAKFYLKLSLTRWGLRLVDRLMLVMLWLAELWSGLCIWQFEDRGAWKPNDKTKCFQGHPILWYICRDFQKSDSPRHLPNMWCVPASLPMHAGRAERIVCYDAFLTLFASWWFFVTQILQNLNSSTRFDFRLSACNSAPQSFILQWVDISEYHGMLAIY